MADNSKSENHDFLMGEFEQMFNEKRHTDGRFTFFVSMYFAIITIIVSVFAIVYKPGEEHYEGTLAIIICGLFFIAVFGVVTVSAMIFNRVNNVKAVRQINQIRNHVLNPHPPEQDDFIANYIMEMDSKHPKFHENASTQVIVIYLISILNAVLIGISLYLLQFLPIQSKLLFIVVSIVVATCIFLLQNCLIWHKLKRKDNKEKA
jgi:O-antigen/teichoic acid export membrane protein